MAVGDGVVFVWTESARDHGLGCSGKGAWGGSLLRSAVAGASLRELHKLSSSGGDGSSGRVPDALCSL